MHRVGRDPARVPLRIMPWCCARSADASVQRVSQLFTTLAHPKLLLCCTYKHLCKGQHDGHSLEE